MLPAQHSGALTPRQRDVVCLLASGLTMKEAGRALGITERTIRFHKYKLMAKLHLQTSADVVRFAIEQRIIRVSNE